MSGCMAQLMVDRLGGGSFFSAFTSMDSLTALITLNQLQPSSKFFFSPTPTMLITLLYFEIWIGQTYLSHQGKLKLAYEVGFWRIWWKCSGWWWWLWWWWWCSCSRYRSSALPITDMSNFPPRWQGQGWNQPLAANCCSGWLRYLLHVKNLWNYDTNNVNTPQIMYDMCSVAAMSIE